MQLAHEDLLRNGVLDVALDHTAQRTCAEQRVEALLSKQVLGLVGQFERHMTVKQTIVELLDIQIDDLAHLRLGELTEHDDVIKAVEELGTELFLEFAVHLLLHAVVARLGVRTEVEARVHCLGDIARAQIGGQDDDRVLEVHLATLAVGQMTIVKHLKQRVEDVGMGLLNLVEQHDGERLAAHLLGELAALLVSDIPRRRAEQTGCGVLLGELGHVDADQRVLVIEQELRQGLGELRLADAGGAGEDEGTCRTLRILQADTRTPDGPGERGNRFVLADDALVQLGFHVEQLLGFRLGELEDRNTRRAGHDLGNDLLVHFHLHVGFAFAPRGFLLFALGFQLLLAVAQFCSLLEVLLLDGFVLLSRHLGDLRVKILELGWGR